MDQILRLPTDQLRAYAYSPVKTRQEGLPQILRGIPLSISREIQAEVREYLESGLELDLDANNIAELQLFFGEELKGRILYLPTYRRIEKDLKTIFPEMENEIQEAIRRRGRAAGSTEVYVELVNFGMEDVKAKLNSKLERLRFQALYEVNGLTTRYLRDVIRNEANTYSADLAKKIDVQALDSIFRKVDDSVLNSEDRENINLVVSKIKARTPLEPNEKYVSHYVAYLIDVAERIEKYERPVVDFIKVCNSYLYGKKFVFDNIEYTYKIDYYEKSRSDHVGPQPEIKLEDLSSGEKQIVSLFSQLILDEGTQNYIIIDEPELSLSVDWQQRFLADIAGSEGCAFIGAVTHSPYIFDNELDKYAVDVSRSMN